MANIAVIHKCSDCNYFTSERREDERPSGNWRCRKANMPLESYDIEIPNECPIKREEPQCKDCKDKATIELRKLNAYLLREWPQEVVQASLSDLKTSYVDIIISLIRQYQDKDISSKKVTNREPDFTKPLDIKAFFYDKLGACGCSELDAMISVVRGLLEWCDSDLIHRDFEKLFYGNTGVYYLIIGLLDNTGLCEHGCSIRCPWLIDKGKKLLAGLQSISVEKIEEAEGTAYNGLYYLRE